MDKQVVTRRGLFVLGLVAVGGRAFASDDEGGSSARPHHRGYKVGGGMVVLVMAAVAASMAVFGEFRRNRASRHAPPPLPAPTPLPEEAKWSSPGDDDSDTGAQEAPAQGSLRYRRVRQKPTVEHQPED